MAETKSAFDTDQSTTELIGAEGSERYHSRLLASGRNDTKLIEVRKTPNRLMVSARFQ